MEGEGPTNALAHKLQKDISSIGTLGVLKASMKIFENHAKDLVTPVSQVLVILSTVAISAWAFFLLLYLDHEFSLPGGIPFQTICPASLAGIDEGKAPLFGLLVLMVNFGLWSVTLSIWQCHFTRVVGRIYIGESVPRISNFPLKELLLTEVWTSSVLLFTFLIFVLSIRFAALSLYHRWSWFFLPIALFTAVGSTAGLVAGILISQLATVVCLMGSCCSEEVSGRAAVTKAGMVLRGRWRVGLGVATIHGGAVLLMGSNLLRPGFGAGIGTRVLFSAFQILLLSIWRQIAYLCWVVLYVSCRAFHHDFIGMEPLHPEKERSEGESHDSVL